VSVTAAQEAAFESGTLGVAMSDFQLTVLLILYSILYLWAVWVMVTQWRAWCYKKINFYHFLVRSVRAVFITLLLGFFLM
jgi:integrating conjugative element protein (TIGR03758 family)